MMERDKISDDVRYVVNSRHIGAIFPTARKELNREVHLNDGAEIDGAIYSRSLYITAGTISVSKATFARNSIRIRLDSSGLVRFGSSVCAGKSMFVEGSTMDNYVRIRGDLTVENANLRRTIVYGNIFGSHIRIEDCVVLGGIYAEDKLAVQNSLIGTFMGKKVHLNKGTTLWLPNGIGTEVLELSRGVKAFTFSLPKELADLVDNQPANIPVKPMPVLVPDIRTFKRTGPESESADAEPENPPIDEIQQLFQNKLLADSDTFHYLDLQPRLYYARKADKPLQANTAAFNLLLNSPGILAKELEEKVLKFDEALWLYLNKS